MMAHAWSSEMPALKDCTMLARVMQSSGSEQWLIRECWPSWHPFVAVNDDVKKKDDDAEEHTAAVCANIDDEDVLDMLLLDSTTLSAYSSSSIRAGV